MKMIMTVHTTRYENYLLLKLNYLSDITHQSSAIFYNHSNLIIYILDAKCIMILLFDYFDLQYIEVLKNE